MTHGQSSPKKRNRLMVGAATVPLATMLVAPHPAAAQVATANLCVSLLGINIGTCNAQASSFTVATPAGVSIGGNQITGLGSGLAASAGDLNSVAIGNGASTSATALNSVAIGNLATVTAANSVAIGNGSVASRGANLLYTPYALTVPASSAGEFSIGSATGTRQLTNLAPGSLPTDAVNVAQLTAVNQAVTTNATNLAGLQSTVTANTLGLNTLQTSVAANTSLLNGVNQTVQTLGGTVTGLTTGLASTNANVAALTGTVNTNTSAITANTAAIANNTTSIAANAANTATNAANLTSLGNQVSTLGTSVATNTAGLANVNGQIGTLTNTVNNTAGTVTSLGNQVTQNTANIAQNTAAIVTNAANTATNTTNLTSLGNQVTTLGTNVAANTAGLTNVNGQIGTLTNSVNAATGTLTTLGNQVTQNTTNIAANTAGLANVNGQLGTLTNTVNTTTGTVTLLGNQVAQNTTNIAANTANIVTNAANTATNTSNLNALGNQVSTLGTNVAANTAGLTNVNGQLGTLANTVNATTGTVTSLGNQVAQNTTDIAAATTGLANVNGQLGTLTNTVNGTANTVTTLGNQVAQNTASIATNGNAIASLGASVANGAIGPIQFSTSGAPTTPTNGNVTNDLTLVGKIEDAPVSLHNVANGTVAAGSTDAVNGGQVFALGQTVNSLTDLAVSYDDGSHKILTLGGTSATAPVSLANVAAGTLGASSTDAVNGAQLFATNTNVDTNSADIVKNTTDIGNLTTSLNATTGTVANQATQLATLTGNVTQNATDIAATVANVAQLTGVVQQNGQAITDLGADVTAQDGKIEANTNAIGLNADAILQLHQLSATGAIGPVQYSNSGTPTTPNGGIVTNDLTLVGTAQGTPIALHNVANGQVNETSTDAVNGSQLYAVESQIGSSDGLAVSYDDSSKARVTLGGVSATAPVKLTNVADGTIVAGSSDAVTGNQLFQTNSNVANNTTNITNLGNQYTSLSNNFDTLNGLAVTYNDTTHTGVSLDKGGPAATLTNVADGNVAAGSSDAVTGNQLFQTNTSITNLGNQYTTLNSSITNGGIGPVQYSGPNALTTPNGGHPTNDLTLVGADTNSAVALHNVAAGQVSSTSTDAVNGSQLYAVESQMGSSDGLEVAYDDSNKTRVTLGGTSATAPVSLTNVADGNIAAGSSDAVTGNQLFQTNSNVTNVTNTVNALSTTVATDTTNIANLGNQYTTLNTSITNGGIGPVQYSSTGALTTPNGGHPTNDLTLVGADTGSAVALHNVAAGQISANSTDAVNGSQLYTIESQMGSPDGLAVVYDDATKTRVTLGGAGSLVPVGLTNVADGNVALGSTDAVNGNQLFQTNTNVTNLGNTVTTLGATVATNTTNIANLGNQYTNLSNNFNTLNSLAVTYNDTTHTGVSLDKGGPAATLTNVADGNVAAGSSDAVTGNQLFQTNTNVANNTTNITNLNTSVSTLNTNVATNTTDITNLGNQYTTLNASITNGGIGPVQYSAPTALTTPNGGHPTNDLTLVGADTTKPVALHNVADGDVSANSTDAVNGSQLYAVESQIGSPTGLAVAYDDSSKTRVTFGGASATAPVTLTNVADGNVAAGSSDAVTGNQLFQTNSNVTTINNTVNTLATNVAINTTDIANLGDQYTTLTSNITNGAIGPVQYSSAGALTTPNGGTPTNDLTLVGADQSSPVALHNLAAGVIGDGSTDAINGAQLGALGSAIATKLGSVTYNPATNSFTGNFTYAGNSYSNVQAVFNAIGDGSTDPTDPATAGGKYFHTNSTLADSDASGMNSTAIGPQAASTGSQSVAMGSNASAQSDQSVAIGSGATAKDGMAVSIGMGNIASGDGAVAIGDPSTATGDGAVVLGKDDNAAGTGAIALGNTNTSTGEGAAAIGSMNTANGLGAVALGEDNAASGTGAIAIGSDNNVSGNGSLAIGRGIVTSATDTMAIGSDTVASAVSAVALGNRAQATGTDSVAVGTDTTATGLETSTFGQHADSTADYATAVGANAQANGMRSTAFGVDATASASQSSAFGAEALANANYALTVGQYSSATGVATTALGTGAMASGYTGTALGSGASATQDYSVALGSGAETTRGGQSNYQAFGLSGSQDSLGEVAIARTLTYTDPVTGVTPPTGNRQITGLAAGYADTDAVNVAQLKGVSSSLGTVIAGGFGGGSTYNSATGSVTGPNYTLFGTTYSNVGDALQALASFDSTNGGNGSIANPNAVTYADDSHAAINLAGNGTQIHNVASGNVAAGSTDAVNGSQLAATNANVAANTTAISTLSTQVQNGAIGTVQYSNAATPTVANGGTKTNDVTLVGANTNAPVGLHNVADGNVAAGSTDAVNGEQLAATNAHVSTVEATANSAMTMGQNSVQYDSGGGSVTLGGPAATAAVGLHNVADGTSATDAVNLGQLASATNAAVGQSEAYTDARVAALSFDLGKVQKRANAGTAGALAMAGMPQPYEAGRGMISAGMAAYQGQSAIAVGLSKALSDEHTVVKLGVLYNSQNQVAVSGGVGYQF